MIILYTFSFHRVEMFFDFLLEESKGDSVKIFADSEDLPKYIKKSLFNNYKPFKVYGKYLMGSYGDFVVDSELIHNAFIDYIILGKIKKMDEIQNQMDIVQDQIFELQSSKK